MNLDIVLAEDQKLIRSALKNLIENEGKFKVVGEADNGREAVRLVERLKPDLLIIDLGMTFLNGIEAIEQIRRENYAVKIIVLTMHSERRFVCGALKAGANGYLLKMCAMEDLLDAIDTVQNGHTFLSPQITDTVVKGFIEEDEPEIKRQSGQALSRREREVLQLFAEGFSTTQIAEALHISRKTVETHKSHIMKKLNITNLVDLVKYAFKEGVIFIEPWLNS